MLYKRYGVELPIARSVAAKTLGSEVEQVQFLGSAYGMEPPRQCHHSCWISAQRDQKTSLHARTEEFILAQIPPQEKYEYKHLQLWDRTEHPYYF